MAYIWDFPRRTRRGGRKGKKSCDGGKMTQSHSFLRSKGESGLLFLRFFYSFISSSFFLNPHHLLPLDSSSSSTSYFSSFSSAGRSVRTQSRPLPSFWGLINLILVFLNSIREFQQFIVEMVIPLINRLDVTFRSLVDYE